MSVINIQNLTRDYGAGRGIFDVSFQVEKGDDSRGNKLKGWKRFDGREKNSSVRGTFIGEIHPV